MLIVYMVLGESNPAAAGGFTIEEHACYVAHNCLLNNHVIALNRVHFNLKFQKFEFGNMTMNIHIHILMQNITKTITSDTNTFIVVESSSIHQST